MNSGNVSTGGVGFFGFLAIALIVLKLLNKITWSWVWVLSPIWIPAVIALLIFLIGFIVIIIKR